MGHGTIQMTLGRYGHLMDDHDDEMIEAMSRSYAKHSNPSNVVSAWASSS